MEGSSHLRLGQQDQKSSNTSSSSSSSQGQGTYVEEIISKLALSSNSFKTNFEKNLARTTKQTGNAIESIRKEMDDYMLKMNASIS